MDYTQALVNIDVYLCTSID